MRWLALLPALMLFAGCSHSPPTRFFTLDAMPSTLPVFSTPLAPVQLKAVHIPALLDRSAMVSRMGANRLKVDDQDQWGAPLGEMMRRVLAQDLMARLPAGTVILPDAPTAPGVRTLVVNVLQFQADADGRVILEASWTLMAGNPTRRLMSRDVRFAAASMAADAGAQAAAMSRLLGKLSDQIATVLTST